MKSAVAGLGRRAVIAMLSMAAVGRFAADAADSAPTLEGLVRAAMDNSPDTEAAAQRVAAARAAHDRTAAAWYPGVGAAAAYAASDNPPQAFMMDLNQRDLDMRDPAFDPNRPDDTQNLRLSLTARYRLFDGGRRTLDRQMAGDGVRGAAAQRDGVRNALAHEVTRGYYTVLQAGAFVRVREETVASLEENLRVARERHAAGTAVQTDVLNLEVKLAEANEDLIRARNGVRLAVAALNTAIGRDLVPPTGLPEPARGTVPASAPSTGDIERRPELQAAMAAADRGGRAVDRARRDFRPTVSAFGSYDWDSDPFDGMEGSYQAGAMLEWDLFDGNQRSAAVREASARQAAAAAEVRKARNQLRLDLQQADLQLAEARERMEVTRKSLESAGEALRIAAERYRQGAADLTELLTAQLGLTAIRTRDVAAYYDCLTALSNVERARGTLAARYASNP